ncbi:hypothetical protein F503_01611 [Ophiostoma piceae UAMH 11346]|uniref:2EXR domain-containing protein n=1 Tax=Ophiostoma piceae (strain UAMH 11346) TaxID=1262450 RepID=S3CQG4_OPHP1|nr:hypothetical protein F503_01611 [Ophiostoma piceae UAMH 11346]
MGALLLRDADDAGSGYGIATGTRPKKTDNPLVRLPPAYASLAVSNTMDIDTPPSTPRLGYSPPPSPAPSFDSPLSLHIPSHPPHLSHTLSRPTSRLPCPSLSLSPPSTALSLSPVPSQQTAAPLQPPTQPFTSVHASAFHRFMDLPTELRLKIWLFSFTPRVVEVHRRKSHYADMNTPYYQSWSANPPALAVSYEARTAALRHYSASIRLAVNTPCELAGGVRLDLDRRLYIAPHTDTLAMLGDFNVSQTVELLNILRQADCRHFSKIKLAICASSIGEASLLLIYGRTIFHDIEQLTLFLYKRRMPPATWLDGQCALVDCRGTYQYRRFLAKQAAELRVRRASSAMPQQDENEEWITVGRRPLQVRELVFGEGATLQDEASSTENQKVIMPWSAAFGIAPPTPPMDSFFRYW